MADNMQGSVGHPDVPALPLKEGYSPNKTRRKRVTALAIALVVVVAAVVSVVALRSSTDRVVIGVIVAQEDSSVSHSEEVRCAVRMAIDELNAWGGLGNTRMDMVFEETLEDDETLIQTFEDMETEYDPLVYVTTGCTLLSAIAPLAEAASAPLLGLSSFPGATDGYTYTYRFNIPIQSEVGSAMAIMDRLNVSSLGLIYTDNPRYCTIHDAFKTAFIASGGTVQPEMCSMDQTDFSSEVANLTGNDAIFAISTCSSLALIFQAIHDSGYEGYVVGSSCASSTFIWPMEAADSLYLSAPLLYKPENIPARAFIEDFSEECGINVTHRGAVAYDIIHLVHGLLDGKEASRSSLEYELSQGFVFTGIMGNFVIAGGEHDFGFDVYPAKIVEGELLYL